MPEPPAERRGRAWIGYLVAAACLIWVFHDIRLGELWGHLARMRWWILAPAVACDIASYVTQGARWSAVLRSAGRLSLLKATQAIYAGLFVNEVLPMRVGEVLRAYLVSRWLSLRMTTVLSSILVERFCDGIWLALAVGAVVLTVPLPHFLVDAEEFLAAGVVLATLLFVYLVLREQRQPAPVHRGRLAGFWRLLGHIAAALRDMGRSRYVWNALVLSGLLLLLQAVAFWLAMVAWGFTLSFWHGVAVVLILHLGTMIPSAPSNLGTYQFFTVLGLTLFGVDKTQAGGFSMLVFLVLTIPLWAIGGLAMARAGLTLAGVRAEVSRIRHRRSS